MRQSTGYTYGDGENCISYKCEGCGQRVRVTLAQARYFHGVFTACSQACVQQSRAHRTQQGYLGREASDPSAGAAGVRALGPTAGAAPEQ